MCCFGRIFQTHFTDVGLKPSNHFPSHCCRVCLLAYTHTLTKNIKRPLPIKIGHSSVLIQLKIVIFSPSTCVLGVLYTAEYIVFTQLPSFPSWLSLISFAHFPVRWRMKDNVEMHSTNALIRCLFLCFSYLYRKYDNLMAFGWHMLMQEETPGISHGHANDWWYVYGRLMQ